MVRHRITLELNILALMATAFVAGFLLIITVNIIASQYRDSGRVVIDCSKPQTKYVMLENKTREMEVIVREIWNINKD